jgi:hypothetical protein
MQRINKNKLYQLPSWKQFPKWLRVIIIILLSIILLLVAIYGFLAWYVNGNKKQLIRQISEVVADNLNGGQLHIRDIDVAFWKTFPSVSIHVKDVTLHDSLYPSHQKQLLNIKDVYVRLKPLSLLGKNPEIGKVFIANGEIYMFKDSTNYTNASIFKSSKKNEEKTNKQIKVADYMLENVHFVFDNFLRNKKFEVTINNIDGTLQTINQKINILLDLDATVGQLGFNLKKGGFLVNTKIEGPLELNFLLDSSQLVVHQQKLKANGMPIVISANFNLGPDNNNYNLIIDGKNINFTKARAILSKHIANKLKVVEIEHPVNIYATIDGAMQYSDTPKVIVDFNLKNNTIQLPIGELTKTDVKGRFSNEFIPNNGHGNENSVVFINTMKAHFEGVPVTLDSSYVLDFAVPKIYCRLQSTFPVEKLDELAGSSFNLKKGLTDVDIFYSGPLTPNDPFKRTMNGHVIIKNAALTYLPRNLKFNNCNATIVFQDQDIFFKNVNLNSATSSLQINGNGKSFLSAYFNDQFKADFDLNINSEQINLNEFKSFFTARKTTTSNTESSTVKFKKINHQLDQVLDMSEMTINLNIKKFIFNKISASNIKAQLDLQSNALAVKNVHVNYGLGTITLNGHIDQSTKNNNFKTIATIQNVDISHLFEQFENFGLNKLTYQNIKGIFSANLALNGILDEEGNFLKRSLEGKVNFHLKDGALVNFEPLLQVKKYAFKGRNLSNITLKELKNTLELNKGLITIPPMEIISSAIYMRVQGVYGLDKGTDIALEIPLRNPKKDEKKLLEGKKINIIKGIVINLRAKDDGNGKVKLNWDPNKNGIKENEIRILEKEIDNEIDNEKEDTATSKSDEKPAEIKKKKWWQR